MGATSRRLSVPAPDLPSAVRSTASSRSPHEAKLVLYARDSSSESMRALLATIKVPAGWAGAGGGERGEGHQAGQEAGHPARRGCWRQGRWGRGGHDLAGGGRQARMLESAPFKRVGAGILGGGGWRGRGWGASGAGGGVGWDARGRGVARATNRLLVSESR